MFTEGGVTYEWAITRPDATTINGTGTIASILAGIPGTYTVTFTAQPTRTKCPPPERNLGETSATAVALDLKAMGFNSDHGLMLDNNTDYEPTGHAFIGFEWAPHTSQNATRSRP